MTTTCPECGAIGTQQTNYVMQHQNGCSGRAQSIVQEGSKE
jgi:hypothetical protein